MTGNTSGCTMTEKPSHEELRPWSSLDLHEQNQLRAEYQPVLDKEATTCSLDTKIARFADWLQTRGVAFSAEEMRRR
jgi:hypothetical protein